MTELTTEEMTEVHGGGVLDGLKAISVGNVALALNVGVNVLSGNGSGGGGLNTASLLSARAGTISFV